MIYPWQQGFKPAQAVSDREGFKEHSIIVWGFHRLSLSMSACAFVWFVHSNSTYIRQAVRVI